MGKDAGVLPPCCVPWDVRATLGQVTHLTLFFCLQHLTLGTADSLGTKEKSLVLAGRQLGAFPRTPASSLRWVPQPTGCPGMESVLCLWRKPGFQQRTRRHIPDAGSRNRESREQLGGLNRTFSQKTVVGAVSTTGN